MWDCALDVQRFRGISHPHVSAQHSRMPENFSRDQRRDGLVSGFAEHPFIALEIVVAAGKLHRYQFAGLHELDLPAVHFLAKRVHDWAFDIFRFH